jgi:NAD(P)-dependent dehydrogenase (short-subunit alcohol dehydrogenase family)
MRRRGHPGEQRGRDPERQPHGNRRRDDASRWKEIQAKVAETAPLRRTGQPPQVADLVVFLASARASYISGTILTITGDGFQAFFVR